MHATDRPDFLAALAQRPLLLDAAMGSRLIAEGLDLRVDDPSLWVLDHPEVVLAVHRRDVEAGSDAVVTNTFGANSAWLCRFGRHGEALAVNREAIRLARLAVGPGRFLLGSIGPTASDHPPALLEQAEALIQGTQAVDALLLETHRFDQATIALRLLRGCQTPIIVSLFTWPEAIVDVAECLVDLGAQVIGANCQIGLASALKIAQSLRKACDRPLLIKPSAGLPGSVVEKPETFEAAVPGLLNLGVRLIGGCCGSTEAHISALRRGLDRVPGKTVFLESH